MAELAATAAEVAAVAADHATAGEEGRRLAPPVVDALRDAGLFRL